MLAGKTAATHLAERHAGCGAASRHARALSVRALACRAQRVSAATSLAAFLCGKSRMRLGVESTLVNACMWRTFARDVLAT